MHSWIMPKSEIIQSQCFSWVVDFVDFAGVTCGYFKFSFNAQRYFLHLLSSEFDSG